MKFRALTSEGEDGSGLFEVEPSPPESDFKPSRHFLELVRQTRRIRYLNENTAEAFLEGLGSSEA